MYIQPNDPVIQALRSEINEVVDEIHQAIELLMQAQGKALKSLQAQMESIASRLADLETPKTQPDPTETRTGKEL